MSKSCNSLEINGITYVRQNLADAEDFDGLKYVIIRTTSAGVFAGYLKSRNNKEVVLIQARRLWYWDGAASLSQLAVEGVTKPSNCKFAVPLPEITLTEATEVIPATKVAQNSIAGVKEWRA